MFMELASWGALYSVHISSFQAKKNMLNVYSACLLGSAVHISPFQAKKNMLNVDGAYLLGSAVQYLTFPSEEKHFNMGIKGNFFFIIEQILPRKKIVKRTF